MRETSFRQLRRRGKPPQEESGPGKHCSVPELLKGAAQVTGLRSAGAGWDEQTSEQAHFPSISQSPPTHGAQEESFHFIKQTAETSCLPDPKLGLVPSLKCLSLPG